MIDPGMASRQRDGVLRALARWRVPHVAGKEAEAPGADGKGPEAGPSHGRHQGVGDSNPQAQG